jgi:hypothetical protein
MLGEIPTSESSESLMYASCHREITNVELRKEARISKSYKRHTISLVYIPGRWRQTVLSVGLLGQGFGSSETR